MYGIFTIIYLHLADFYGFDVGKYTSPMDACSGVCVFFCGLGGGRILENLRRYALP